MSNIVTLLFALLRRFGGLSLLALGFLDSSFLFIPLGADLLLIAMVVHIPVLAPYYAMMLAVGSVCGCALVDFVGRRGGERGLEHLLSRRRIRSVTKRVGKSAGWALVLASLMPPPFPFTPVVLGASALQFPRKRLLAIVGAGRLARYMIEALLAIYFGRQLLIATESRLVEVGIILLMILSLGGSAVSAYQWIRRARSRSRRQVN